ncbi:MAG: IS3 family transposase [Nitrospirae bacterium]|nr:IS3 family transposase [Nitrospirota bacterium]
MSNRRYTEEFKSEAVKQVSERGYKVHEVCERLGVSTKTMYVWLREARGGNGKRGKDTGEDLRVENLRLRRELKRVEEERDILKKAAGVLCQGIPVRYAFIKDHRQEFRIVSMCRVLRVHRSGYYVWLKEPESMRSKEDKRLTGLIRQSYEASGCSYGSPRIVRDLHEMGERCSENRVARLMRKEGLRAKVGYKRPRYKAGRPAAVAINRLEQNFEAQRPDTAWVTDITYIRTWEGWLYLAVVIDLYSRMVIGWSMKPSLARELVIDALLMAVWRRKPKHKVIIHSDQGTQYGSDDWIRFCREHNLDPSMSRRGNCYDNAVAESFFSSLKKERIGRRIYPTRQAARSDVFDYIEMFYNRARRHSYIGQVSPYDFERSACGNL